MVIDPEPPPPGFSRAEMTLISKSMARALRHQPEAFGLTPDEDGWVLVEDLVRALRARRKAWSDLNGDTVALVVATNDKQRYELDGDRIRARYGHSLARRIRHEPAVPPDVLFHGTSSEAWERIRVEGLKPMRRQYVHLSPDSATALGVGRRVAVTPLLVCVDARAAHADGVPFWIGGPTVWLTDRLAPRYLSVTA